VYLGAYLSMQTITQDQNDDVFVSIWIVKEE